MTDATPAGAPAPAPETVTTATPSQEAPAPVDPTAESATSDNPGPDPAETTEAKPLDAPAADAAKAKPADTAPEKLPPAEKRIAKLTAKLREAERKLEEAAKANPPAEKPETDQGPTPDQFKTWEEYEAARIKHAVDKATREAEAKRAKEAVERQFAEVRESFLAGVDKAAETYPDFKEVVMDPDGVFDRTPEGEALASIVMLAGEGAHDVAYHLASNPKEADRIKALNPVQAALAIGRLSASVAKPAPRKVPKAPDPPTEVKGGDAPTKDLSKMTMAEYEAYRMGKKRA